MSVAFWVIVRQPNGVQKLDTRRDLSDTNAAELQTRSSHRTIVYLNFKRLRNGLVGNLEPSAAARARSC